MAGSNKAIDTSEEKHKELENKAKEIVQNAAGEAITMRRLQWEQPLLATAREILLNKDM